MPKLTKSTLKKIEKVKMLINKYSRKTGGMNNIIGRKKVDNDKIFNTFGELNEWLNTKEIYKEFTSRQLNLLKFKYATEETPIKDVPPIDTNISIEEIFTDEKNKEKLLKLLLNAEEILKLIKNKSAYKELEIPLEIIQLKSDPASIRVNRKVLDEFYTIADRYPAYSRHAIINLAFKEFIEKYNK